MPSLPISGLPAGTPAQTTDRLPIGRAPFGAGNTFYLEIQDILDGSYFTKVGTAYIGGDQTGNARGAYALDVQPYRGVANYVVSGLHSASFGSNNQTDGDYSLTSGYRNNVALGAFRSAALGYDNKVYAYGSNAFGGRNLIQAYSYSSSAFGYNNNIAYGAVRGAAFGYGNGIGLGAMLSAGFGYENIVYAGASYAAGIGYKNIVRDANASAIGCLNLVTDAKGSAIGYFNSAGVSGSAMGYKNQALGDYCSAFGFQGISRVDKTTNICGPQIIRRDDAEADPFASFPGVETVLMTNEVDLKIAATTTLTLPANCHFWLDEVFVEATVVTGLIAQPFLTFGITGNNTQYVASTQTTLLTAARTRERFSVTGADGEASLTATVATPATGTTVLGRFGFRGLLIEDE